MLGSNLLTQHPLSMPSDNSAMASSILFAGESQAMVKIYKEES